ncbi:hypothetical protein KFE25_004308 [Diacronema lutheri]|uniref:NAD(P)-binding domain-containing protein n=2 Tax=Diacronema lutheri TaxID=2081491 RepID=A0A8J5X8I4_DIALT|nr:hypothetical protein KFE25_004308 [Diacronema lutheri]
MACTASTPLFTGTTTTTITIIYGTRGGISDVGKFAVQQASQMPHVAVRAIALYDGNAETNDPGHEADVTDDALKAALAQALRTFGAPVVDVNSPGAAAALEAAVDGADAVVCAFSSRQPELPRYLAVGMRKVVAAMGEKRVQRLVALSSFGIGDDFLPISPIKVLWACLLRTFLTAAARDLHAFEAAVEASHLDYALLRPVGLTPSEAAIGRYEMRTARGQGGIKLELAKADMARCCLDEALKPTIRRGVATVGSAQTS